MTADLDGDGYLEIVIGCYGLNVYAWDCTGWYIPMGPWAMKGHDYFHSGNAYDQDGDGLNRVQEQYYKTNYTLNDTDGDGLLDGDEVYLYRTNATNNDTDGDGWSDGYEILNGFDPLNELLVEIRELLFRVSSSPGIDLDEKNSLRAESRLDVPEVL